MTHYISEQIGKSIVTGKYTRTHFPTEKTLCEEYLAARTVIREAVKMLCSKGMLVSRQSSGTFVTPEDQWNLFDPDVIRWLLERNPSIDMLVDVTQIRLGIEPIAAFLAAKNATDFDREKIVTSFLRIAAADNGEDDRLTSEMSFHAAILQASGNRFCRQLHEIIEIALCLAIRLNSARQYSSADHKHVASAILAGDSIRAESSMRDAIQRTLDLALATQGKKSNRLDLSESRQPGGFH